MSPSVEHKFLSPTHRLKSDPRPFFVPTGLSAVIRQVTLKKKGLKCLGQHPSLEESALFRQHDALQFSREDACFQT